MEDEGFERIIGSETAQDRTRHTNLVPNGPSERITELKKVFCLSEDRCRCQKTRSVVRL